MVFSPYKLAKIYCEYNYGIDFQLSRFLTSPDMVANAKCRADIMKCVTCDPSSSFEMELLKHTIGCEYEEVLYSKLASINICFETESEMRLKGKPKTPDAVLLIPLLCHDECGQTHIVNWIDSKAMFADEITFLEHVDQLRAYVNRYYMLINYIFSSIPS